MCKHPLKGWKIGINPSGKANYKITSYSVDHVEYDGKNWYACDSPFSSIYSNKVQRDYVEIPCGKCVECRLMYSRQWADRCMLEAKNYNPSECWFLTVTYDDDNIRPVFSDNVFFSGTLYKEDLQLFLKNLRRQCEYYDLAERIRFFGCGEYGSKTHRPHYHLILFGLDLIEVGKQKEEWSLITWSKSHTGNDLYRSLFLEKIWKKGLIAVAPMTWDTCAYTARYVIKKAGGLSNDDYYAAGVYPEFSIMSRRPGIAREYYDEHKDKIFEFDEIFFKTPDGGRRSKPPRYYDSLYELDEPELYKSIKNSRKEIAERIKKMKLEKTDLKYEELLEAEERVLEAKLKMLKRNGDNYEA